MRGVGVEGDMEIVLVPVRPRVEAQALPPAKQGQHRTIVIYMESYMAKIS